MIRQAASNLTTKTQKLTLITYGLALALLVGVLTGSAASALSGSIGGRPANPDDTNQRTRSIFVHTLNFGQSVDEGIRIINSSDQTQTANVYAVDASVTSTGSLTCKQKVEAKKDVGSWIKLNQESITLAPGTDQIIPFTITVPAKNADVGEHNGCMVIEPVSDDTASGEGGIRIRTRSAIRVAVTIPGNLKKELSFAKFDVHPDKGNYYYDVGLKNTGNVSIDADIRVKMTSLSGKVIFNNGGQYPVVSGTQLDLSFVDEHPPLFGGFYWVEAIANYDGSTKNEIGVNTNTEPVKKEWGKQLVFIAPTINGMAIIVGLLGLLIGGPIFFIRRFKERKRMLQRGREHVVNPGETLKSIAEHYGITWKSLATLNKLKAPYEVKLGSSLIIPEKKQAKKGKAKKSTKD